jgi:hypothetical protein
VWIPLFGFLKINWDVAIGERQQSMGMGFILRDHLGGVLASHCSTKPFISDPGIAKVLVACKMLKVVAGLGFHNVALEGDYLRFFKLSINRDGFCFGHYGHVSNEVKILLNCFTS